MTKDNGKKHTKCVAYSHISISQVVKDIPYLRK
jgi:hypothetical protein